MTTKAVRAQIKLGTIDLDVFQMPDGGYVYSQTQAFISIADDGYDTKQAAKRYIQKTTGKQAQTLIPQGFSSIQKVKIDGENETFNAISQADVTNFWLLFAMDGNAKAMSLLAACAVEALERRADAAFGKKVTEEERNAKLALRAKSKVTRRNYTDVLKERMVEHIGEERYKSIASGFFRNTTIQVNQHLYNQPHFKCDRDNMTENQLTDIELFERQLERRALRFPEHTAEELLAWMLENY